MSSILPNRILIVEPDRNLLTPYVSLNFARHLIRVNTIDDALEELQANDFPEVIMVSASFPPAESVRLLEQIKSRMGHHITPLIFVINLSTPISSVLGTTWGGQTNVLTSISTPLEVVGIFEKLLD